MNYFAKNGNVNKSPMVNYQVTTIHLISKNLVKSNKDAPVHGHWLWWDRVAWHWGIQYRPFPQVDRMISGRHLSHLRQEGDDIVGSISTQANHTSGSEYVCLQSDGYSMTTVCVHNYYHRLIYTYQRYIHNKWQKIKEGHHQVIQMVRPGYCSPL